MTIKHLHKRMRSSHKGQNGRVLIVAGSNEYVGAAALAGLAALRSGVDYVTIAAPEKVAWTLNKMSPDFITVKLPGSYLQRTHARGIRKLANSSDVMLVGNGVGTRTTTKDLVGLLAHQCPANVVDADAVRMVRIQDWDSTIFTPHRAEFETLLKNSKVTSKTVKSILNNNIILLKGRIDEIYTRARVYRNTTGNAGMTVAGTGDVLAGLTAGLVAQRNSLVVAARASSEIMGRVGNTLYKKYGYGYTASDCTELIAKEVHQRV